MTAKLQRTMCLLQDNKDYITDIGTNDQPCQLDPLKNPLVLSIIANQLSDNISNLKNFRLVCTSWRDSLPSPWRSQFKIWTIHQTQTSLKTTSQGAALCHWTLFQFRKKFKLDPSSIPEDTLQKFEFHSWTMESADLSLSPKSGLKSWLHSNFHLNMTVVILTNCSFLGKTTVFSDAFLRSIPNLQTLRVIKPQLSKLAWDEIHYANHPLTGRAIYYEHDKLEKVFLEMNFTDYQFQELWATFHKSLPELKELSVKRLVESHQKYNWIENLLRTLSDGKQKIHLEEVAVLGSEQLFCIETAPIQILKESFQSSFGSTILEQTLVKLDWTINQTGNQDGQLMSQKLRLPFKSCGIATIAELNLKGQIFGSLCFLTHLFGLKKFVWKAEGELGEEEMGKEKGKQCYPVCPWVGKRRLEKMNAFVDSRIEINECRCKMIEGYEIV